MTALLVSALCEWTRLPVEECSHCTPEPPVPAEGSVVEDSAYAASPSRCPLCESWVWPGERIRLVDGVWVCGGCAQ